MGIYSARTASRTWQSVRTIIGIMKGVFELATSEWCSNFSKEVINQRDLEQRLKAAWIEYDSTVDTIEGDRRGHLKKVATKHNVSFLDVLEWYNDQPEDIIR